MSFSSLPLDRRLSVAPMMDWTDRHCRYFHRLFAPRALLYTEMVTTGALHHGDHPRHLDFDLTEHPIALQLGGSEPQALVASAKLGEQWGYDEVNLNCGCPSERVLKGAFGACLMAEPATVADGVKAMRDAVSMPVTVKHRIGIDKIVEYGFVRDFVGTVREAGCTTFIVHARNAILKGLSPRENREIPPLRYAVAAQLKRDFPDCDIVLNGGVSQAAQVGALLGLDGDAAKPETAILDGVMIGREAYHRPEVLREMSQLFWPDEAVLSDAEIIDAMSEYAARRVAAGDTIRSITRHMLGFGTGRRGSRRWRQMMSDPKLLAPNDPALFRRAWAAIEPAREAA
jgi:tRNA-dihydrouridine synthase A